MKTCLMTLALAMGLGMTSAFTAPQDDSPSRSATTQQVVSTAAAATNEPGNLDVAGAYELRQCSDLEDFTGGRLDDGETILVVAAAVVLALILI